MKISWAKGFTLIELLIVIAVLGVLAGGIVVVIDPLTKINSANLAKAKTFSASVENALIMSQVGKWSFEEGSGNIVKDISGYGNDGTLNGGVAWKTSAECGLGFGGCLSFDGVNGSYVQFGTLTPAITKTDSFTIEGWVKISATGNPKVLVSLTGAFGRREFFANWGGADHMYYYTTLSDGNYYQVTSTTPFANNQWTHMALTYNASTKTYKLYQNAVNVKTSTATLYEEYDSGNLRIGQAEGEYWFGGLMDEVRIYSQALLSSRIQQIYAQGLIKHQLALK